MKSWPSSRRRGTWRFTRGGALVLHMALRIVLNSALRKVKKLFQTMDSSGDGTINLQEFSKLVNSPMLKFWMGQLEPPGTMREPCLRQQTYALAEA